MYVSDNGTNYGNGAITKWSLVEDGITSITESGTTATATTSSAMGLVVGETVTISGVTPSGYNGTVTVTAVSGATFTFTATSGLGTATGFGTATAWIENGSIPYTTSEPGFYWLDGLTSSNTVTLYSTYGNGGNGDTGGGLLYTTTDTSGWGSSPLHDDRRHRRFRVIHVLRRVPRRRLLRRQQQTTTLVDNGPNASTYGNSISLTVTVLGAGLADSEVPPPRRPAR